MFYGTPNALDHQ